MTLLCMDPGATSAKRVARAGAGPARPVVDAASGSLRAAPVGGATPEERAAACVAWARRDVPDLAGLALIAAGDDEARSLGAALARLAPDLPTVALPAPIAAALAAEGAPEAGAVDAVLDLGQAAMRLALVGWRALGDGVFPRLLEARDVGPGGAALDARLRRAAEGARDAGAFHELKELFGGRGPWTRAWGDAAVRLDARAGASAVAAFVAEVEAALPAVADALRAAGARRALLVGGLAHLAPVRAAVARGLAPLPVAVVTDPLFAAARGGLAALERPATPRAAAPLSLVLRGGGGVVAREVAPAGAALPARFGPLRLRATAEGEVALHALEGDALLEARVRAPAGRACAAHVGWDFDAGWTVTIDGGPPAPFAPSAAAGVREALDFRWDAHGQPVPLDLVVVFRATQGGGEALARAVAGAVERLAGAAAAGGAGARLRAIAVGDHAQGHLRPAFVTLAQPGWTDRPAEVAGWCAERLRQPVDGIDAAEAFECALREAAGLDWRPDATRLLVVLADAPAHTPDAPPYCPVDWRVEARRLTEQGVRLVPVHVAVGGAPPALRRQALAFLEGLGQVLTLRAPEPGADLLEVVAGAARARRLDAAARRVLEAVAFEEAT